MKGPEIGPCGEDITWPDQVAHGADERLVYGEHNLAYQEYLGVYG